MSGVPSIVLVDLETNEKHCLNSSETILGRNWLKSDDQRISRSHGVLAILSNTTISLKATHQNPIFYRKKDNTQVHPIRQNQEVSLSVGDFFGLLVDKFWFSIRLYDENFDPQMNASTTKRQSSSNSEPDSTNKKVKTEPDEFQSNGGAEAMAVDTRVNVMNFDGAAGGGDGLVANNQLPSTSSTSNDNSIVNQNGMCPLTDRIKSEPIDLDENEAQSMSEPVAIKVEPACDHNCCQCSANMPIKTEIKTEGGADAAATSSNEAVASSTNHGVHTQPIAPSNNQMVVPNSNEIANQQPQRPARRECCRHGVRCYRRNPTHRDEECHPGDVDYRLPDYPDPPAGAPQCPFLDRCYRRNPTHFQQFSHKVNYKGKEGYEATAKQPKKTTTTANYANQNDDVDDEEEDPFASSGDSDADYNGDSTSESDH